MASQPALEEKVEREAPRARGRGAFYTSNVLAAEANGVSSVSVDVFIHLAPEELDSLRQAIAPGAKSGSAPTMIRKALNSVAGEMLTRGFEAEFTKVIEAYRGLLLESLGKGEDVELRAALNRARLQEKVLASTSMVDQAQACQLLGMSTTNPSATMKRKEGKRELMRFTVDGRAVYPLVQFDVDGRRVFPAVAKLLAAKPDHWSDFRLLHWLTRLHLDFDGTPGEALGADEAAVLAAFAREIDPAVHG